MERMPYCAKCGNELDEGDSFCPKCGTPTGRAAVSNVKPAGTSPVRIFAFILGGIILVAGFGVLTGGVALMGGSRWLTDAEGYIKTDTVTLRTDSYAVVQQNIDVTMNMPMSWRIDTRDIVTVRITARSLDPGKEVFLGVASEQDAYGYLSTVAYDRLVNFAWRHDRGMMGWEAPTYMLHPGVAPSQPPTGRSSWVASVKGTGTQTLEWVPKSGDYWIVLMNADGSRVVAADVQLGVKTPLLQGIGNALLASGLLVLLLGAAVIYYGGRR